MDGEEKEMRVEEEVEDEEQGVEGKRGPTWQPRSVRVTLARSLKQQNNVDRKSSFFLAAIFPERARAFLPVPPESRGSEQP